MAQDVLSWANGGCNELAIGKLNTELLGTDRLILVEESLQASS